MTESDGVGSGKEYGKYQIAFNLSAVKDLSEEIGIPLPSNASDAGWTFQLSDFFDYKLDKVTLHGVVILTSFNGDNNNGAVTPKANARLSVPLAASVLTTTSVTRTP